MQIYPADFFAEREFAVDPTLCFAIMPFTTSWADRTFTVIRETVQSLNYRCVRADDYYGKVVLSDIWQLINRAGIIIADLTGANPNVYYELGIAHTVGKDIIPLLQVGDQVPFDQQPFRILFYEDNRDGEAILRARLPQWIDALSFNSDPQMLLRRGRVDDFNNWRRENEAPVFVRCNFSEIHARGVDLSLSILSESNLSRAILPTGNFTDSILIRTIARDADSRNANLAHANLSEAKLEGANFAGANMSRSILMRARLDGCLFTGADLAYATIDRFTYSRYQSLLGSAIGFENIIIEGE